MWSSYTLVDQHEHLKKQVLSSLAALWLRNINIRGGVEDTRLKAKDTKKFRGQGQGQTLSRSRPKTKDTDASVSPKNKKKVLKLFFRRSQKKVFKIFFQAIST